jgi:hypothetical protein
MQGTAELLAFVLFQNVYHRREDELRRSMFPKVKAEYRVNTVGRYPWTWYCPSTGVRASIAVSRVHLQY